MRWVYALNPGSSGLEFGQAIYVDDTEVTDVTVTPIGNLVRTAGVTFLDIEHPNPLDFGVFIDRVFALIEAANVRKLQTEAVAAYFQQYAPASGNPLTIDVTELVAPVDALRRIYETLQTALNHPLDLGDPAEDVASAWVQQLQAATSHSIQLASMALLSHRLQRRHAR